jgi:hypothetical protein
MGEKWGKIALRKPVCKSNKLVETSNEGKGTKLWDKVSA